MSIYTRIRQHERGLLFRYGDFVQLLGPGKYPLWGRLWDRHRDEIQVVDMLNTQFVHPLLDVLLSHEDICEALHVVDLKVDERALVWKDGRLGWILGAGRYAFWREPYHLKVETFNVQDLRFEHPHLEAVLAHKDSSYYLKYLFVEPQQECLVFHNGRLVGITVKKGNNDPTNANKEDNAVDALAGATITGNGVSAMISESLNLYKDYLESIRTN